MADQNTTTTTQNADVAAEQIKNASLKSEVDASLSEKETAQNLQAANEQKEKDKGLIDKVLGPIQQWYDKKAEKKGEKAPKAQKGEKKAKSEAKATDEPNLDVYPPKLNDKQKKEILDAEKVYNEGVMKLQDLIAPSAMKVMYKGLQVSGLHTRSFFVYSYPRFINTNWLSPVINFDVTMDMSQFIYPIDSSAIMKVLKTKVAQMQSSMRINAEKGLVRDPALETALQDAEALRTAIQRGQEKFFQYGLYFTIYSDDEDKLEKISKQLESILGGRLVLTKRADLRAEQAFNSTLPLGLDEIEVHRNMNTSPLSTTFPFTSTELTSNEGILYGLNRHNDSLIIFDRFSLENANSVVFAKSGAGKSYAVKLEILRYLMLDTDVIVIDPENEYEELCQTVGGSYMKVSLNSDRRINPFDLPTPLKDETLKPGDLLRSAIINLHGLLKLMLGEMTPTEEGILDKALNDVYALKGITMDLVDPSEKEPPTMEDLQNVLSGMRGADSLVQRLQKYTTGTYSGVFNMPTNIDLATGLVVFSIRDLEDALRPTAIYIILNYIWNKVRSDLKKRILVIDEAWSLMQHEDSAKFLYGLVKRARKYYLGVTTITQDVEDFLRSELGKPVITNSSMQLLLKQSPTAAEKLQEIFNLTEGEKYLLLNSGVGQGLFFAGNKHVAIQTIASYTEDKIVTTNPEQLLKQTAEQAATPEQTNQDTQ
jgi:type IV secretory pathway VirB4 component